MSYGNSSLAVVEVWWSLCQIPETPYSDWVGRFDFNLAICLTPGMVFYGDIHVQFDLAYILWLSGYGRRVIYCGCQHPVYNMLI